MKVREYAVIILSLCLAGCLGNRAKSDLSRQINVFGTQLYSGVDYREIAGVGATEEPCLKGYERNFDSLDITLGYGFDGKIRRIATRNPRTTLFGISPGMSAEEGKRRVEQAGLSEVSPNRFVGDTVRLTLLVDEQGAVFGITVEADN